LPGSLPQLVERARAHDGVFATVGWHPHQRRPPTQDELQTMRELAADTKAVAIGEIGLDYYWRPGYHEVAAEVQQESLRLMLRLALELDLPVVIHDRDAHEDTLTLIREVAGIRGTMHAFSGDRDFALACVETGMHISVAGPVTYPSAQPLRDAVAAVPAERLLVETDSPFLPPQPWRGKPNQPAYVVETARKVAELKGMTLEDFALTSSSNASRLFGLPPQNPAG
jgi:TatD DNase family protein